MPRTSSDRIEKQILLQAPRSRVWRALTDAKEFGTWFRVALDGPFVPGKRLTGRVTYPGYEHVIFEVTVEKMESERSITAGIPTRSSEGRLFGGAHDPRAVSGRSRRHASLGGRVSRSHPIGRRDEAFRMNSEGWTIQVENIARHVTG
jgi:uncharacterized protein YndB with AHSA1/START domain